MIDCNGLRILNGYAGLGGTRKLWANAQVTAIEINQKAADYYSKEFPLDKMIVGDVHELLPSMLNDFDLIALSPPCPSHSWLSHTYSTFAHQYPDMKLYQEIILLQHRFNGLFFVENVVPFYKPLIPPSAEIGRHIFWSNFKIPPMRFSSLPSVANYHSKEDAFLLASWLGITPPDKIYLEGSHNRCQVLRNCVHPLIGAHLIKAALSHPVQLPLQF